MIGEKTFDEFVASIAAELTEAPEAQLARVQRGLLADLATLRSQGHQVFEPAVLDDRGELVPSPSRVATWQARVEGLKLLAETAAIVGDMVATISAERNGEVA